MNQTNFVRHVARIFHGEKGGGGGGMGAYLKNRDEVILNCLNDWSCKCRTQGI